MLYSHLSTKFQKVDLIVNVYNRLTNFLFFAISSIQISLKVVYNLEKVPINH